MDVSAASQGHSASNEQSSGPDASAASGGGDINFQELFESTQKELQSTKSESQQMQQRLKLVGDESKKTGETLERIKAALMGEQQQEQKGSTVDEQIEGLQAQMDYYIQQAIEAERKGSPIPLTANLAVQSLKHQIETLKEREEYRKELAEIKRALRVQGDPARSVDQIAYSIIDSHLSSVLATIYGPDEDTSVQRDAISKLIVAELKDLQKSEPQSWDRIRRDQNAQKRLVNHFAEKIIPPKARQIMQNDEIRRTPIGTPELVNAWREAKELAAKGDQQAKAYAEQIRSQILQRMAEKSMPGMGRGSRFNDE